MDVGQKIKELRNKKKLTQAELAKKLELAPTTVSAWERGANYPSMDTLPRLAEILDTQVSYFYEGVVFERPNFRKIPIIGKIACGNPIDSEENVEGYTFEVDYGLPNGDLYAVIADGESMSPTIDNGSHVIIQKQSTVDDGQIAAVRFRETGEVTLKRVRRHNNIMLLIPDNKDFETLVVTHENPADIVGRVVRSTRNH